MIYSTILASLILQVRVHFGTEPVTQEIVTIVGSLAALVLIAFALTNMMYSILIAFRSDITVPHWLNPVLRIYFIIFVGITSLIFLCKLAIAILRRRRLGQSTNPILLRHDLSRLSYPTYASTVAQTNAGQW